MNTGGNSMSDANLGQAVYKNSETVGQRSTSTRTLSRRSSWMNANYSTGKTDRSLDLTFLHESKETVTTRKKAGRKPRLFTAEAVTERNRLAQQAHRERKERLKDALQKRLGQAEAQHDVWKQKAKAVEGLVSQLQEELRTHKDV